ncbi:flagellar protein FliT [Vibrio sonorensis]|uniref:flagellar protein FliT n=1 Tax=Vibrio sonorensis TaxID=1004316 RepID=UPI0008D8D8DC|nr:flagellar protein FliT [Vibrio sonorensis]
MLSADKWCTEIALLSEVDHVIKSHLASDSINPEEIVLLVDRREQILQTLLNSIKECPEFAESEQWQTAIRDTQLIAEQMQAQTQAFGKELSKLRHGNKSVQQYKKFL